MIYLVCRRREKCFFLVCLFGFNFVFFWLFKLYFLFEDFIVWLFFRGFVRGWVLVVGLLFFFEFDEVFFDFVFFKLVVVVFFIFRLIGFLDWKNGILFGFFFFLGFCFEVNFVEFWRVSFFFCCVIFSSGVVFLLGLVVSVFMYFMCFFFCCNLVFFFNFFSFILVFGG